MSIELQRAFFSGWDQLLRTVVMTLCAYVAMILLLRTGGKRTLAQLNAYDLVVTVALGSTLASAILSPTTSIAQAVLAFALLVGLQYLIAFGASRSSRFERLINGNAELVFHRGQFMHAEMRRHRLAEEEVLQAIRGSGQASLEDVEAVVFETNGKLTVVPRGNARPTALRMVRGENRLQHLEDDTPERPT